MAANTRKKQHPKLANPYTPTDPWPAIPPSDAQVIQELLGALLSPIGRFRAQQVEVTAAARSKKRKRRARKPSSNSDTIDETPKSISLPPPTGPSEPANETDLDSSITTNKDVNKPSSKESLPPKVALEQPPIQDSILVGFNNLTRHLELLASHSAPPAFKAAAPKDQPKDSDRATKKPRHVAIVFISTQRDMFNHLPALCTTASLAHSDLPPTRIVPLGDGACTQLAKVLGVGRLSCLGVLEDAPDAYALVDYVRERVPIVKVSWLEEVVRGIYQPVKVEFADSIPKEKPKAQRQKQHTSTSTSTSKPA